MNNPNPYQTPEAHLQVPGAAEGELASRASRFWAVMIDGLIGGIIAVPLMMAFGVWAFIKAGEQAPLAALAGYVVSSLLAYLAVHGWLLHTYGQSVGKKLLGIKIVDLQGANPGLVRLFLIRYAPVTLVSLIPGAGALLVIVDALLIFKNDRRCGHDMIAGTQVVNA